jgi:exodeoxyribonuclease V alpha subunit
MIQSTPSRMQELLAAYKAKKAAELAAESAVPMQDSPVPGLVQKAEQELTEITRAANQVIDRYGKLITLNAKQLEFVETCGRQGNSGVLIGAAGTGKTTTQFAVTQELIQAGHAGILDAADHKHLVSGTPGIVICAYTRRAVANIKRNLPTDLQANAITVHKLLEYQPVYYEVMDENTGESKTKMQFEATRNAGKPLPPSIRYIIIEESSMLGTDLYKELVNACPHNPKFIFLGDIQQLPPVFGPAILGFKLLELPVVELTEVYRQALESPIISLAHRILSGNPLPAADFPAWKSPGKLTIHPWKKKIEAQAALNTAGMFFKAAYDSGAYDTEEDIILIPFNKAFGTDELNKIIANHIAHKHGRTVYQVIAGFNKHHFAVGDKVLYDKEDATIVAIHPNPAYSGAMPVVESPTLDYWGYDSAGTQREEISDDGMDFLLSQVASQEGKSEDRVRQSSHVITLRMNDSDAEVKVDKASEINAMLLGYCLTVHKSQGSEFRKVFFVAHQSHATMLQRELLYTAVTRAREELYIICEPEMFTKGILSQRVKGNTLAEKAEYFKGKLEDGFSLEG